MVDFAKNLWQNYFLSTSKQVQKWHFHVRDDDDDELDHLHSAIRRKLHLKGALQRLLEGYIKQVCS